MLPTAPPRMGAWSPTPLPSENERDDLIGIVGVVEEAIPLFSHLTLVFPVPLHTERVQVNHDLFLRRRPVVLAILGDKSHFSSFSGSTGPPSPPSSSHSHGATLPPLSKIINRLQLREGDSSPRSPDYEPGALTILAIPHCYAPGLTHGTTSPLTRSGEPFDERSPATFAGCVGCQTGLEPATSRATTGCSTN